MQFSRSDHKAASIELMIADLLHYRVVVVAIESHSSGSMSVDSSGTTGNIKRMSDAFIIGLSEANRNVCD